MKNRTAQHPPAALALSTFSLSNLLDPKRARTRNGRKQIRGRTAIRVSVALGLVFLFLAGCATRSGMGARPGRPAATPSATGTSRPYLAAEGSGSAEIRKMTGQEIRAWQDQVRRQFDFPSLTEFLTKTIQAYPVRGDVDLRKSMVGREWATNLNRMRNGDWEFSCDVHNDTFQLTYAPNKTESVVLNCRRFNPQRYELKSIENLFPVTPIVGGAGP